MTDVPLPVKPRKPQIRPKVRAAIGDIVGKGLRIADAAKANGLSYEGLRLALHRPHVRAYVASVKHAWLESETFAAWNTVSDLRQTAASEDVKLKAARTVIAAAGELEPERAPNAGAGMTLVQIVIPPRYGPEPVITGGLIELPPFDPSTYVRPAPALSYVDVEG